MTFRDLVHRCPLHLYLASAVSRAVVAVRLFFCLNDRRKAETGLAPSRPRFLPRSLGDGDEDDGRRGRRGRPTKDGRICQKSPAPLSTNVYIRPPEGESESKPPFRRLSIRFVRHSPNTPRYSACMFGPRLQVTKHCCIAGPGRVVQK